MLHWEYALLAMVFSYIIGSFPTAYLVGRLHGINIFEAGSGNMGTTNTLRTLGTGWALVVLAVDLGKGALAVLLSMRLAAAVGGPMNASGVFSAIAVVAGHNWSLFVTILTGTLKGGKGAATALGTWLILLPAQVVFIPFIVMVVAVIKTRFMSLGVLLGVMTAALLIAWMVARQELETIYLLYYVIGFVILFRFRDNIKRLASGSERRIGETIKL
jgi:glycerol-3-phosphate acyltransferase PlsY